MLWTLSALGSKSVISRLKKNPFWWSYCLSTDETLLSLRELLLYVPQSLSDSNQVYSIIFYTKLQWLQLILPRIRQESITLPSSLRACVWADRSPSSLIRRVAMEGKPYNSNAIPSNLFSAGPIVSRFTTETHPLQYGIVWCYNHKTTCHFQ